MPWAIEQLETKGGTKMGIEGLRRAEDGKKIQKGRNRRKTDYLCNIKKYLIEKIPPIYSVQLAKLSLSICVCFFQMKTSLETPSKFLSAHKVHKSGMSLQPAKFVAEGA